MQSSAGRPLDRQLVVAALRAECLAMARLGLPVARCGMGERRARAWAQREPADGIDRLVLIGVSGGLDPDLRAGDVIVASAVDGAPLEPAEYVSAALRQAGLHPRTDPIASSQHLLMRRAERAALHAAGALCVDMESAAIVRAWGDRCPVTVVRVVVDTVHAGLIHPLTLPNGVRALVTIRRIARALAG